MQTQRHLETLTAMHNNDSHQQLSDIARRLQVSTQSGRQTATER
jgi:Mn-dependent DtxR family transcriptional regulator